MCLVQGHNVMTPVKLEPTTPRSLVKQSTTEPLRSQLLYVIRMKTHELANNFIMIFFIFLF